MDPVAGSIGCVPLCGRGGPHREPAHRSAASPEKPLFRGHSPALSGGVLKAKPFVWAGKGLVRDGDALLTAPLPTNGSRLLSCLVGAGGPHRRREEGGVLCCGGRPAGAAGAEAAAGRAAGGRRPEDDGADQEYNLRGRARRGPASCRRQPGPRKIPRERDGSAMPPSLRIGRHP